MKENQKYKKNLMKLTDIEFNEVNRYRRIKNFPMMS
jgi:hypothetical protein